MTTVSKSTLLHIVVEGRVQGVGFRYHTENAARRHGVSGWVRNLATGEVEILARVPGGEQSPFIEAVRKGPPLAHVVRVRIEPGADDAQCPTRGFSSRY